MEQESRTFSPRIGKRNTLETAASLVPVRPDLEQLRHAAATCKACPLWKTGTQTVFGEGPTGAEVMFIGEQPGFEEDLEGRPFVGPAGKVLDRALQEAGIDRTKVYVTNAVKHFKWEQRGKLHMHKKPSAREVAACQPWLTAEIDVIKPKVIVCLGATAAQALLGSHFKVTEKRGELVESSFAPRVIATIHPSYILRVPDDEARHAERRRFTEDLKKVAQMLNLPTEK